MTKKNMQTEDFREIAGMWDDNTIEEMAEHFGVKPLTIIKAGKDIHKFDSRRCEPKPSKRMSRDERIRAAFEDEDEPA